MRKFIYLLLILNNICFAETPQDIVIKSRFDAKSSASFIERIRTIMINNGLGDPYNQRIESPIIIDFNEVLDEIPENTQTWLKDLQALLSLKLFESSYKLKVEGFSYSISRFNSELNPFLSGPDRVEYVSLNYVQGLKISATKLAFQVELQRTQSGSPIKFDIELVAPEFLIDPDLTMELPMGWYTSLVKDSILLSLHTIDLSKVFTKIVENPELIELHMKDVIIPEVTIRVGDRTVNFDREKIKRFLSSRKEEMKLAIIDMLKTRMRERFSNIIKDKPQEIFLPRENSIKGDINSVFIVRNLKAHNETKLVEARLDGHFCVLENLQSDICRLNQVSAKIRRPIEESVFNQSMQEIDLLFLEKRANIAVSIGEHYLNQLILAAAQAGILELGGDSFKLGPEKAFVLAEEKGEGFHLYLDIIHKLKRSQSVMVGRSELRFPVRLSIGLKIVLVQDIPYLQIKVLGLKTGADLLIKGAPQYDLPTNVNTVRFREKVIAGILQDIRPFDQKILVELKLEEFKDTYLEELSFFSDGLGRANAVLHINTKK